MLSRRLYGTALKAFYDKLLQADFGASSYKLLYGTQERKFHLKEDCYFNLHQEDM